MSFSLHLFNIENDAYDPHPQSSHKYAKKPCCQNMNIFIFRLSAQGTNVS